MAKKITLLNFSDMPFASKGTAELLFSPPSHILIVSINYQLVFDCDLLKPTGEKISGQMAEISIHNPES